MGATRKSLRKYLAAEDAKNFFKVWTSPPAFAATIEAATKIASNFFEKTGIVVGVTAPTHAN